MSKKLPDSGYAVCKYVMAQWNGASRFCLCSCCWSNSSSGPTPNLQHRYIILVAEALKWCYEALTMEPLDQNIISNIQINS